MPISSWVTLLLTQTAVDRLELGAGGGLVGLAVASGCAIERPLYVTDQLEMFELMKKNIALNGLNIKAQAAILNWYVLSVLQCCPTKPPERAPVSPESQSQASELTECCRGEALSQDIIDFKPNVILAADCVYFEPAFPLLLATMTDLLALCPSAMIYFCFKKRRRADMHFLKKAQKKFSVVELTDEDRPVFSREGLFLFGITSRIQASNNATLSSLS